MTSVFVISRIIKVSVAKAESQYRLSASAFDFIIHNMHGDLTMYLLVGSKESRLSGYPWDKFNWNQFILEPKVNFKSLQFTLFAA